MKRAVVGILAAQALAFASPAMAANTTLTDVLAAAKKQNVDRRLSTEQRRQAAAQYRAAWTALLPSLTAQAGWTYNQYPAIVQIPGAGELTIIPENQLDGTLRAELPIIDTTRWFRAGAASASDDGAQHRDEGNWDNIVRQVSTTFYSFSASQSVRTSAKKSLDLALAQEKLQDVRFKAGSVTELDVSRARAEVQRNRQLLADAEASVANMRRALRTLTGLELDEELPLPKDNLQHEGTLEELEGKTENVPMVLASGKDALAANRLAWASRLSLVPQVTANFTQRFTNATGFIGRVDSYTAGLGLVWRFDGPTLSNISVANAQASIAELQAEKMTLAARDQIQSDWQRLTAAIVKVGAAEAQVEAARRASQVAKDRYNAGASTQIEVIQADRDLFIAEVNHIQSRAELASSHVSLRMSAGLDLADEG